MQNSITSGIPKNGKTLNQKDFLVELNREKQKNDHRRKEDFKDFKQDVIKFLVIWVVPGLALAWFICSIVNGNTDFNLKEPQQKIEFALSTMFTLFAGALIEKYINI